MTAKVTVVLEEESYSSGRQMLLSTWRTNDLKTGVKDNNSVVEYKDPTGTDVLYRVWKVSVYITATNKDGGTDAQFVAAVAASSETLDYAFTYSGLTDDETGSADPDYEAIPELDAKFHYVADTSNDTAPAIAKANDTAVTPTQGFAITVSDLSTHVGSANKTQYGYLYARAEGGRIDHNKNYTYIYHIVGDEAE